MTSLDANLGWTRHRMYKSTCKAIGYAETAFVIHGGTGLCLPSRVQKNGTMGRINRRHNHSRPQGMMQTLAAPLSIRNQVWP